MKAVKNLRLQMFRLHTAYARKRFKGHGVGRHGIRKMMGIHGGQRHSTEPAFGDLGTGTRKNRV